MGSEGGMLLAWQRRHVPLPAPTPDAGRQNSLTLNDEASLMALTSKVGDFWGSLKAVCLLSLVPANQGRQAGRGQTEHRCPEPRVTHAATVVLGDLGTAAL